MGRTLGVTTDSQVCQRSRNSGPTLCAHSVPGAPMFHRTVLAAGIAATAFVAVPGISASAALETCQGEEATIVGGPDSDTLIGTPGRDVIVTNGAFEVQAGDG